MSGMDLRSVALTPSQKPLIWCATALPVCNALGATTRQSTTTAPRARPLSDHWSALATTAKGPNSCRTCFTSTPPRSARPRSHARSRSPSSRAGAATSLTATWLLRPCLIYPRPASPPAPPPAQYTPEEADAAAMQDALIEEFLGASAYLFTVPMYNLTMPSVFKAWLDQI